MRVAAKFVGPTYNILMPEVVVYSGKGCHFYDVVKEMLAELQSEAAFHWREVDIDSDPELRSKFNEEVPVVYIEGKRHSSIGWIEISF